MKKTILTLCLAAACAGAYAQQLIDGSNINDFRAVALTGGMSVEMIPADKPALSMELHGVEPTQVTWGVADSTLSIKVKASVGKEHALIVRIYYTAVRSVTLNGADVRFTGALTSPMFTADVSTGAKFAATVDCLDFMIRLSGNSAAQLDGKARYLDVDAGQRSKVDARNLEARNSQVASSMGSEVYTWSTERLVTRTNTGGAIFWRGEPTVVRSENRMGGNTNYIGK